MRPLKASSGRPACRSGSMTTAQLATLALKEAAGFKVEREESRVVVISRGNDFQLIRMDGVVQRAHGAKR